MNEGLLEEYKKCWKSLAGKSAEEDYEYPASFWDLAQKALSINLSVRSFEEGIRIFIGNNSVEKNPALEVLDGILEQQGEQIVNCLASKVSDLGSIRVEAVKSICKGIVARYNVEAHIPHIALHILTHLNCSDLSLEQAIQKSFVDSIALSDLLKKRPEFDLSIVMSVAKKLSKEEFCTVLDFINAQFESGLYKSWNIVYVLLYTINAIYETEKFDSVEDYLCMPLDCCFVMADVMSYER